MAHKLSYFHSALSVFSLTSLMVLTACSTGGEGKTEPVNMSQFKEGSDRFSVMSSVGQPEGSVTHEGRHCDIYKLYTSGLGSGGKAAMTAAEVLTGIGTLGLSEAIWAPVKAGTKPNIHTVLFCYAANEQLVDIYDKNPTNSSHPTHRVINAKLYATPIVVQSGTAMQSNTVQIIPNAVSTTVTQPVVGAEPAPIQAEPTDAAGVLPVGTQVDHVVTDPVTGQQTIFEKAAQPKQSASAGNISLDSVSQEATNGLNQVKTGRAVVNPNATADDLNSISSQKALAANQAAIGHAATVPALPQNAVATPAVPAAQ
ncbi:MAG: hypothetical protein ABF641_12080 [Acetobacter sp.]